jgi:hypothetical protein
MSVLFSYIPYDVRNDIVGVLLRKGAGGSIVVKALYYKPEGRGFDSR